MPFFQCNILFKGKSFSLSLIETDFDWYFCLICSFKVSKFLFKANPINTKKHFSVLRSFRLLKSGTPPNDDSYTRNFFTTF
jgi:hypothetical protein